MNEFRLEYQFETGTPIDRRITRTYYGEEKGLRIDIEEYIEWLEEQLSDAMRVNGINQMILDKPIFYEKDKKT